MLLVSGVADHMTDDKHEYTKKRHRWLHQPHEETDETNAVNDTGSKTAEAVRDGVFVFAPLAGSAGVDVKPGDEDCGADAAASMHILHGSLVLQTAIDEHGGVIGKEEKQQPETESHHRIGDNAGLGGDTFFCGKQRFSYTFASEQIRRQSTEQGDGQQDRD